ncbi:MAG: MBL fold metallo-hydrolase [Hyphomonadaceae bacterium]|nr:MBL fold metallo-hydrolase [Hyphomonadaceae bacterium]
MREWIIGLSAVLLASCGPSQDIDQTPDASAAAIEAGLPSPGSATEATKRANAALASRLDLSPGTDGEDARRDRLAFIEEDAILAADGSVVWAIPQFDFLDSEAPETVNPSLWRQSQLAAHHGLFRVMDGIYQVRGYDLSVMSVIEGETGWIIVDPLTANETAAAALKLVNDTLGERPVTGVLYTHSHADHFGGARGVISDEDVANGVPVLAPIGFSESAVSENLIAGNQMSRRATLMFGNTLPRSTTAHVGSGLGPGLPNGTISLILPTEEIEGRGTRRVIDGVTFEFIDAAGTEAPAEFMFYLPEKRALCTAEVATATFHNVLTPRGAKVRDALKWSRAIDYVLAEYGADSDVVFASHHWPTWGQENVVQFLESQRDIYRYVHDQTLRNANAGATMVEAAEAVEEPDFQAEDFTTRGYYGTLNHNAKAVYQHYFGWWGGVPAEYNRLPHEVTATRYVEAMGGAEAVLEIGQNAFAAGDYRWAAEVFNHLVFADPERQEARDWLSATYEQLGFQAESGAWRSYYLTGAAELRRGLPNIGDPRLGNPDFLKAVPSLDLFDALAARYNPGKMDRDPFAIVFEFPDTAETVSLLVERAVLVPREGAAEDPAATVTMDRRDFDRLILGDARPLGLITSGKMKIGGNRGAVSAMFDALDQPPFWFNTVVP